MSSIDTADAPIYAQLVEERGDVPTDVRQTAEETQREVEEAIRFGAPGTGESTGDSDNE